MREYTCWVLNGILMMLTGCQSLSSVVQENLTEANALSQICSSQNVSSLTAKIKFSDQIKEVVAKDFGFSLTALKDEKGNAVQSLPSLIDKIRDDIANLSADDQAMVMDASVTLAKIRTEVQTMNASIQVAANKLQSTATQTQCNDNDGVLPNCILSIEGVIYGTASAVKSDMGQIKADISTFANQANTLAAKINNNNSVKNDITQDLVSIVTLSDGLYRTIASIADANPNTPCPACSIFYNDAKPVINQYVAAETAQLAMNALTRVARDVEDKLDQIDNKTWFVISLTEFFVGPHAAKGLSNDIKNAAWVKDPTTVEKEVLNALFAFSCQRLTAESTQQSLNMVRADTLLYPVYEGIIIAMAKRYTPQNEAGNEPNSPTTSTNSARRTANASNTIKNVSDAELAATVFRTNTSPARLAALKTVISAQSMHISQQIDTNSKEASKTVINLLTRLKEAGIKNRATVPMQTDNDNKAPPPGTAQIRRYESDKFTLKGKSSAAIPLHQTPDKLTKLPTSAQLKDQWKQNILPLFSN
ncbi:hypothetical protein [Collimonas sp.]|jgi:hypothetical protein|uniref:hypothetical protein n=1 Tax=Collimonas sp. TaxID=1963772 RepID=UPI002C889EC4|nr:hypothetical protein [Collimonas sp.]HWW07412.1 hypothetical protein [Collimonas sp.]